MRRLLLATLVALLACTDGADPGLVGPSPEPRDVGFRVLSEEQNSAFCVEGPEFEVAMSDDDWIGVYSRQSDCQDGGEFSLPQVNFDDPDEPEWALAAWWKVEGCLGYDVETGSVQRIGAEVVVRATSSGPGEGMACATALGSLESFLAVSRDDVEGASVVRFLLDGREAGTVDLTG